jgi:hypothetical protein
MGKRSTLRVMAEILGVLRAADKALSTQEIAKRAGVEWQTADKYLKLFRDWFPNCLRCAEAPKEIIWKLVRRGYAHRIGTAEMAKALRREVELCDFLREAVVKK